MLAGHLADFIGNGLVEALEGVDAGSDSGTSLSQQSEVWQGVLNASDIALELGYVAGELLAEGERSGVLQMGSADLDDVVELVYLLLQGILQAGQGREKSVLDLQNSGNVHNGREGIVGRGGHVDMVVGVDRLLAAHGSAQDLNCTVGDDLVGIHVGLGARAGLPDNEREMVNQLEVGNLSGGLLDRLANGRVFKYISSQSVQTLYIMLSASQTCMHRERKGGREKYRVRTSC